MNWEQQAVERLEREAKAFTGNKYEAVIKTAVAEALESFCRQNEEFAQAVVQGGSFAGCMAAVVNGVGNVQSDKETYRRAAVFYFPSAWVEMEPKIHLEPEVEDTGNVIHLDFSDFFS